MTTQTPRPASGADFVRPAYEIRDQIHFIETRLAHLVYPETDDITSTSDELTGELDGLYFALGERRPLFTPVYMFNYYRKKYAAEQQKEKETQHVTEHSAHAGNPQPGRPLATSGSARPPVPIAQSGGHVLAAQKRLPLSDAAYRPTC